MAKYNQKQLVMCKQEIHDEYPLPAIVQHIFSSMGKQGTFEYQLSVYGMNENYNKRFKEARIQPFSNLLCEDRELPLQIQRGFIRARRDFGLKVYEGQIDSGVNGVSKFLVEEEEMEASVSGQQFVNYLNSLKQAFCDNKIVVLNERKIRNFKPKSSECNLYLSKNVIQILNCLIEEELFDKKNVVDLLKSMKKSLEEIIIIKIKGL